MGYEVDYLPVGDGEKSGDAIAIRWGNLRGSLADQRVIVIDGGTKESGEALVEHIRRYYRTKCVDLVICTHCDADHASGLSVVVKKLTVRRLLMHEPWQHADEIHQLVTDGRVTERSLTRKMESGLKAAYELYTLAQSKQIPIIEPFSGVGIPDVPELMVLGPDKEYYEQQLSMFRCMPNTKASYNVAPATKAQQKPSLIAPDFVKALTCSRQSTSQSLLEQFGIPGASRTDHTPDFSPPTSAENDSSAIVLLTLWGRNMMFTGDAGSEAVTRAIRFGHGLGLDFSTLDLFHVPHHGSENYTEASVLDKIGARVAIVSAARYGAPRHPSSKVTNALMDRGTPVYATQGRALRYSVNAPVRPGWIPAKPLPYDESHNPDDFHADFAPPPIPHRGELMRGP